MGKKSAAGLLTSVDSIFTTQEERDNAQRSYVIDLPAAQISDFPNHPFKVRMDESMTELADSVKQHGILVPSLVRPMLDGSYQMVSGHRRKRAAELAELPTVPCIVRELTDDEAIIIMVDSNLQREQVLPSEKAFAYKMKLDAMKRQGKRTDLTSCQVGTKLGEQRADMIMAKEVSESARTIQRYIRLTELIPDLLEMVDEKKISFNAGVEVSFLRKEEQQQLMEIMDYDECVPSLSQAQRLKKASVENRLTKEVIAEIMSEERSADIKLTIGSSKIKKYFPGEYTPKQMEEVILNLLEHWSKEKQR